MGFIKGFFGSDRNFDSKRSRYKFLVKRLYVLLSSFSLVLVLSMIFVFVGVFDLPTFQKTGYGQDDRVVEISDSEIDVLESEYRSDLEKGFCVYGHAGSDKIVVEDIVHDDNPLVQSSGRVEFLCIDETIDRLPRLLTSNYSLVGNVHTHPRGSSLSKVDAFIFGSMMTFQDTFGVYNGERLDFYTMSSINYGLEKDVV